MSTPPKTELKYWLALNQISIIGPIRWQRLLDYFGNLQSAWSASRQELLKAGIEEKIVDDFIEKRNQIKPDLELEKVKKIGVKLMTIQDKGYPKLLREIYGPPPLLYYQGNFSSKPVAYLICSRPHARGCPPRRQSNR